MSGCATPQALFFPGTKGDKGDPGAASTVPGPVGPAGEAGAVGVYTGAYDENATYYDTQYRKDIVFYAGMFWITNNPNISGSATWGQPNVADWVSVGTSLKMVATAIDLLFDAEIAVGLNMVSPGFLKSDNFVQYVSGWLLTGSGRLEAYDALIAGFFSTNSPKFNLEDVNRTMPAVASASFDIPAIADGAIPVNPTINNVTDNALIMFGWKEGANNFITNRFGNTSQNFTINLNGTGTNTSAGADQFYIQIYYRTRTNGGAWGAWTVIGQDAYMNKIATVSQSFDLTRDLTIALTGDNDIQFSAGFSKGAAGTASVGGARITVKAFN